MFLTTKVRYGVRALIELGISGDKQPVLLKDISKKQNLSMKYLYHIFAQLKTKGIIKKVKAKKGGYLLAKEPQDISLYEIIEAIEGTRSLECLTDDTLCPRTKICGARVIWKNVNDKINSILKNITLQDFIKEEKTQKKIEEPIMFSI